VRVLAGLVLEADELQQSSARSPASAPRYLAHASCGQRQVVDHLQMGEEVELLEDDPDPLANLVDLDSPRSDLLALEEDPAAVDRLEQVDAAKQRALAAPALGR